jgi:alkanesulfonate monooxygenase SsuD/methylene tetrahydromethanopterin reductase-like flavin-dependent oxidoreductase (luciferase family)
MSTVEGSHVGHAIELGLDTFGDVTVNGDGRPLPHAQVLRDVVAQGELADQVGLDFIGLGEHHRPDFTISAPDVMLAAIAAKSQRIRLGSAVTVLSSDDPVRVYERFATLHAISSGRAEVIVGRGSFTESFPLFGYELATTEAKCEEKLNLFAELLKQQPVTWRATPVRLKTRRSSAARNRDADVGRCRRHTRVGRSGGAGGFR